MRRLLVPALLCLGLFACRALVGIDDLEFQPAGQGPNNNGTSGGNGGGDGGAPKPEDCLDSPKGCRICCKDTFEAFRNKFERDKGGTDCLCRVDACGAECATSICLGPLADAGPDPDCAKCTDNVLGKPDNDNACRAQCNNDRECNDGVRCMQVCVENKK